MFGSQVRRICGVHETYGNLHLFGGSGGVVRVTAKGRMLVEAPSR